VAEYIKDTNFAATLQLALKGFQTALTKRWRQRVATDIENLKYDFPKSFKRTVGQYDSYGGRWSYDDPVNQYHFIYGVCEYTKWGMGEQESDLSSVSCPGKTYSPEQGYAPTMGYDRDGNQVVIPSEIQCGMGQVLADVENWAYGEQSAIFTDLPLFNAHDQEKLYQAHQALLKIGDKLGLKAGSGSDVQYSFAADSNTDLPSLIDKLSGTSGEGQGWWEGWTGLTANALKDGFFSSVVPTVSNQASIAGLMSNLYSARMAVIEKARASELEIINESAKAFDAKTKVTVDHTAGWKIVQDIGTAVSIPGSFAAPVAAAGAAITLLGMLGEQLNPNGTKLVFSKSLEDVMKEVWDKIAELKQNLMFRESEYDQGVRALRNTVYGVHSFNLEMYDLTENSPEGSGDHSGYTVQVDQVLEIADTCFECAEIYEDQIIPALGDVESAEPHLADENGDKTWGDSNLVELLTELRGYLTTACGRLYTAGEQVKAAAEAYAATDDEAKASFDSTIDEWDEGSAPSQSGEWAKDTDRTTYDPNEGNPHQEGRVDPGHADPAEYETELTGE
jgi:hypothetical protein